MEIAVILGRKAALVKIAEGDMNLGARPATAAAPAAHPPAAHPPSAGFSLTLPQPAAPQGQSFLGGLGQHVGNFLRDPRNMAHLIGASGQIGQGLLGATGAPGLFALSNLGRGGHELGTILRGGITPPAQQGNSP
jgi:hypothetical protein